MKRILGILAAMTMAACGGNAEPTTIDVTNGGERELYLQQNHELTLLADGEVVSMHEPFCMSKCGLFTGEIACALAAEYPTVTRLKVGDSQSFDWDGVYYEVPEGRNCWIKRESNADFEIEVCYSAEYEQFEENGPEPMDDQVPGANLKDPVCERQAFERGAAVEVVLE